MSRREWCYEQVDYEEDLLFAEGFDDAILGVTYYNNVAVVMYDREKCIDLLVRNDAMTPEEAEEFLEYNIAGSYVGPKTPMFVTVAKQDGVTTFDN